MLSLLSLVSDVTKASIFNGKYNINADRVISRTKKPVADLERYSE